MCLSITERGGRGVLDRLPSDDGEGHFAAVSLGGDTSNRGHGRAQELYIERCCDYAMRNYCLCVRVLTSIEEISFGCSRRCGVVANSQVAANKNLIDFRLESSAVFPHCVVSPTNSWLLDRYDLSEGRLHLLNHCHAKYLTSLAVIQMLYNATGCVWGGGCPISRQALRRFTIQNALLST